jgi:Ribonuclease G/E
VRSPAPTCGGRGEVKTARTVCYEMLREILREARAFDARELRVLASRRSATCSRRRSRARWRCSPISYASGFVQVRNQLFPGTVRHRVL